MSSQPFALRAVLSWAFGVALLASLVVALPAAVIRDSGNRPNRVEQRSKPYLLLISIDGFRHDFAERFGATNLLQLAQHGARAESLVPVYPSLTFPSHYSIVTGLRPEKHGLVGMRFYDPQSKTNFSYTERRCLTNASWYGGTPLWVLAEKNGLRSAAFFWVGSEAPIQGILPSFYAVYDSTVPNSERVETVVDWFRLPEELRPHFSMLYFSDVDAAGHQFGPDSSQTAEAVRRVDRELGVLFRKLQELPIAVNVIVVSDHGMAVREQERILLYELADLSGVVAQSNGSHAAIYSSDPVKLDSLYEKLRQSDARFSVYRRPDVPAQLHYSASGRIGDLVIIPKGPYLLNVTPPSGALPGGMHGYDPAQFSEMNGILFAAGPNIAAGVKTGPVDALNLYPLMAHILQLAPPVDLDGNFDAVRTFYRNAAARD